MIVYFHWGKEYQILQQNKNPQKKIIEEIVPYTDVIIGSHSHVVDGHLFLNDTLIVPNLGNLFFPMHQTPQKVKYGNNLLFAMIYDRVKEKNKFNLDVSFYFYKPSGDTLNSHTAI